MLMIYQGTKIPVIILLCLSMFIGKHSKKKVVSNNHMMRNKRVFPSLICFVYIYTVLKDIQQISKDCESLRLV